ncbi:hypothetical protein BDV36DRAFT_258904 [Aspergillus pseudocaelatus]|uniref:Uncharacterized protein n=1 Tax=Aspergillus pseudocaelatus TaxID=1825620 RepID=A0ABQ6WKU4_9EURO|nr:hypothetical protein BDV36DRAFT_258904 [Aspergillus pseudocaelatus]
MTVAFFRPVSLLFPKISIILFGSLIHFPTPLNYYMMLSMETTKVHTTCVCMYRYSSLSFTTRSPDTYL